MTLTNLDRIASRKSWLGRGLRWPLDHLPKDLAVPILSGPLITRRWIVGAGIHRCWFGTYERAKQRVLKRHLERDMVVYDVGANAGFYTLLMARRVGFKGTVHAFEPDPRNLSFIQKHLRLNSVSNVVIHAKAVADAVGEERFSMDRSSYKSALDPQGELVVRVTTLDHVVSANQIEPPDLIKIDVEGAEAKVLRGGLQLLRRFRPTLFLATHNAPVHRECCELLQSCGYRLSSLDNSSDISEVDELLATNR